MQIGQVVDFIISWNDRNVEDTDNTKKTNNKPKKRKATQSEIDAFLG